LEPKGYLEGKATVSHDAPRRDGDHYLVNLVVSVDAGPQYRISSITSDGGPLMQGKDLSQHFTLEVGDVAGYGPFGHLAGELRSFYGHYGYADVEIHGPPVLDRDHALASYHLSVIPGPIYHLRSLAIHNLDSAQETKVRELLGMKPGDVFDETAINALYHKLPAEPSLASLGFTFGPAKEKTAAAVDLSLDFYKVSDKSSVTIK
jgi:outer membrane protein insertion porin family